MNRARSLFGLSVGLLEILGIICLVLMIVGVVADVALKYAFNRPIENLADIVAFYFMVGIVFMPMASTERSFEHINADLFVRILPIPVRNTIYIVVTLISAAAVFVLAYHSGTDALKATQRGDMMMGSSLFQIWPSRWFLPVGFGFLGLALLSNALKCLRDFRHFEPKEDTA